MKRNSTQAVAIMAMTAGIVIAQSGCRSEMSSVHAAEIERGNQADMRRNQAEMRGSQAGMSDANILALLETANKNEIETGQMAQQKSANPKIKMYGQRMSKEHNKMLTKGAVLSKHLVVTPAKPEEADSMSHEHNETMRELRNKSGQEFDRAYLENAVKTHQRVLDDLEQTMKSADHIELRHLLEETRPAIEDHLWTAQDIKKNF